MEINLFKAPPENKSQNRKTSRIGQEKQELEELGLVHALDTDNANLSSWTASDFDLCERK